MGEATHPGPTVPDVDPSSETAPAHWDWDLSGPLGKEPCAPDGEEMPEASPMGESRREHPYSP